MKKNCILFPFGNLPRHPIFNFYKNKVVFSGIECINLRSQQLRKIPYVYQNNCDCCWFVDFRWLVFVHIDNFVSIPNYDSPGNFNDFGESIKCFNVLFDYKYSATTEKFIPFLPSELWLPSQRAQSDNLNNTS